MARFLVFSSLVIGVTSLVVAPLTCVGQLPKLHTVGAGPYFDVKQALGLVENNPSAAAQNRRRLQEKIDAGAPQYPWFFPGASSNLASYYLDTTLILKDSARVLLGIGARNNFGGAHQKFGSYLLMRSSMFGTSFNGVERTATASAAQPDLLVVSGRRVSLTDQFNSLLITGGTNFLPGWYTITAVDTAANNWTLDRPCTAAEASAMTGFYCPALIQDRGIGTDIVNLGFLGKRVNTDAQRASIGFHAVTAEQSPNPLGVGIPTGKHHLQNVAFDGFHVGILYGAGLARFGDAANNWYGRDWRHPDESIFTNLYFRDVHTCFTARTRQAVGFLFNKLQVSNLDDTVFWFDAGGKLVANAVAVQGTGPRQRVLHLGRWVLGGRSGHDPFILTGVAFDGGDSTRNPQLITTDWAGLHRTIRVEFNGVKINRARENDNLPLIDVQSRCYLSVRNATGFWNGCVKVRKGAGGTKPVVVFDACSLPMESTANDGDPLALLVAPGSDAGIMLCFHHCTFSDGVVLVQGEYTTK